MIAFVVAAVAMLLCVLPMGVVAFRRSAMDAVVAYEAVTATVVMVLILLPEGFGRSSLFEFPVLMAAMLLGGGLVFLRSLERWL